MIVNGMGDVTNLNWNAMASHDTIKNQRYKVLDVD